MIEKALLFVFLLSIFLPSLVSADTLNNQGFDYFWWQQQQRANRQSCMASCAADNVECWSGCSGNVATAKDPSVVLEESRIKEIETEFNYANNKQIRATGIYNEKIKNRNYVENSLRFFTGGDIQSAEWIKDDVKASWNHLNRVEELTKEYNLSEKTVELHKRIPSIISNLEYLQQVADLEERNKGLLGSFFGVSS